MEAVLEKTDMATLKANLQTARTDVDALKGHYDARRASLNERIAVITEEWDNENGELLLEYGTAISVKDEAETALREACIDEYKRSGEKTFDKHLSVRVNKKFSYDEDEAVAWAEKNAPIILVKSVDKKRFESLADIKPMTPEGEQIITTTETVTAVIAKEFSEGK